MQGFALCNDVYTNLPVDQRSMLENAQQGNMEIVKASNATVSGFAPKSQILDLPYVFNSSEQAKKVFASPVIDELVRKDFEQAGLRLYTFFDPRVRSIYNSKRAITKPEDLKGLKIRVMQSPVMIDTINALGGSGVPMAFGELYSMTTTIRDVASRAGISVTTASRVLSGSDHPVATEVRRMVLEVAQELNYTPNAFARGLSKREFRFIGLVIPDSRDAYFLEDKDTFRGLSLPDPERDGRMPLLLEAAVRINERIGKEVLVSGTVVGPFTLAANLRGFERLVMDAHDDPEYVHQLLAFTTALGKSFADAFVSRGLGVAINESWISPPLTSPKLYRELAVDCERELVSHIKSRGQRNVGLISGGDTTPLLDSLITTGTSLLIADYGCDFHYFKRRTTELGVVLRGNVDPKLVESGPVDKMQEAGRRVIEVCAPGGRFVLGTGVIPYATPPEHLLALRHLAETYGAYSRGQKETQV